ncbi:Peroxidase 56 [Cocos nucifera]|nr:Peroxidase 56 [Cocos nucifera]
MRLFLRFLFELALVLFLVDPANAQALKVGFYKNSCPYAETIVRKTVASYFSQDPTVSGPLLRLHFHDCFVRGCDGSVLLNSTKTNLAEKDAMPNQSLDGLYVIDAAKEALEKACPGIVSCADIVALAARDAVSLVPLKLFFCSRIACFHVLGLVILTEIVLALVQATRSVGKGSWMASSNLWEVPTGRRDGLVSMASEALANLPSPYAEITQLKASFAAKGLSAKDLAILSGIECVRKGSSWMVNKIRFLFFFFLSGAHAIGNSHCYSFERRLYNFTGKGDADPTLDPNYAIKLRSQCKPGDETTTVEIVPGSSTTFDTKYYKLVVRRRGLFHSDEALLRDKETRDYVYSRLDSPNSSFFFDFGVSMVKMGQIGVLTGKAGEIRKQCALVNS